MWLFIQVYRLHISLCNLLLYFLRRCIAYDLLPIVFIWFIVWQKVLNICTVVIYSWLPKFLPHLPPFVHLRPLLIDIPFISLFVVYLKLNLIMIVYDMSSHLRKCTYQWLLNYFYIANSHTIAKQYKVNYASSKWVRLGGKSKLCFCSARTDIYCSHIAHLSYRMHVYLTKCDPFSILHIIFSFLFLYAFTLSYLYLRHLSFWYQRFPISSRQTCH